MRRKKQGRLLIAVRLGARHNRSIMEQQPAQPEANASPAPASVGELQRLIDERDETIRLLNQALSRALDELDRAAQAA